MKLTRWALAAALSAVCWGQVASGQDTNGAMRYTTPRSGAQATLDDVTSQATYPTGPVYAQPTGFASMLGGDDCACEEEAVDECTVEPFELCPRTCRGYKFGGWTSIGYHSDNSYYDLFNQNTGAVRLHQQYLYLEKALAAECGIDWGFRFDALYGTDGDNTQSYGNPPGTWDFQNGFDFGIYHWALPQAYVEVGNQDWSVKVGHFYTPVGYEVVPANGNFFYSHAFTHNNSEPFTHTGVLGKFVANDKLTAYGGWTLGWDTGFAQVNQGNNFLGGFAYKLIDEVTLTYLMTGGNLGFLGKDAYTHSFIADVTLTERLKYVLVSDLVDAPEVGYDTIGICQYLIYTINDCWAAGARVEWWKRDGDSVNEATFGVNWKPHTNFTLRPEVRHEWWPSNNTDQTILGMDAVITY